ncbi:MAG: DUF190 domain-containing protein [Desulfitobacteriaceae bacterium]|nr:DUF190 domain-containing protein [Desulfitobacteriaceae bacterium]
MNPAPAKLMQIYLHERAQFKHQMLYVALTQLLKKRGISGVTVRRGIMGFGNFPIVLECIDTPERIEKVFPEVMEMVKEGTCIIMDGMIWREDLGVVPPHNGELPPQTGNYSAN